MGNKEEEEEEEEEEEGNQYLGKVVVEKQNPLRCCYRPSSH